MRVDLFDFELPQDLIALRPVSPRDSSRMLVVNGNTDLSDAHSRDLEYWLKPGDAMVFNDTRVIPARLDGTRIRDGVTAKVSVTLHMRKSPGKWAAFVKGARKLKIADTVSFGGDLSATVLGRDDAGEALLEFDRSGEALDAALIEYGQVPLPPYIASKRPADDRDNADYQTVYANERGAVAAPTAGLHFTGPMLERLAAKQINRHFVTLHVGAGTFLPVKVDDTRDHKMHQEWGRVTQETAEALNEVCSKGGRIVCVGTTSLRLLESAVDANGKIAAYEGATDIFITPGYRFKAVDMLMTNFHLPRSTLFMLVSAFAGSQVMQSAYRHAIAEKYRFYSYGDSSLLFLDRQNQT